jgi:hypothetical protein
MGGMKTKPTKRKPTPKPKAQKKPRPDFSQTAWDVVRRATEGK